jgi:sec-independent protein translocase protein TatA
MPGPEWIWVILVIVVLFGASRLPIMGRNVGLGIKEFKKGLAEAASDDKPATEDGKPTASDERDRGTTA